MAFHAEVMPTSQQRMLHRVGALATGAGFQLARGTMDDFAVTGTAEGTLHAQAGGVKFSYRDAAQVRRSGRRPRPHEPGLLRWGDAEAEDMPEMLWAADWPDIRRTIEAWVRDLVRRPSSQ